MDAITVDSLFCLTAAICVLLLLCGGWLCLRYGRGMESYSGNRKTFTAAARAAACFPAHAKEGDREETTPQTEDRGSWAQERSEKILSR